MRRLFVFRKAETGFSAGKGTDSQSKPVLPHSLVNFTHIHRHMITHIHYNFTLGVRCKLAANR